MNGRLHLTVSSCVCLTFCSQSSFRSSLCGELPTPHWASSTSSWLTCPPWRLSIAAAGSTVSSFTLTTHQRCLWNNDVITVATAEASDEQHRVAKWSVVACNAKTCWKCSACQRNKQFRLTPCRFKGNQSWKKWKQVMVEKTVHAELIKNNKKGRSYPFS